MASLARKLGEARNSAGEARGEARHAAARLAARLTARLAALARLAAKVAALARPRGEDCLSCEGEAAALLRCSLSVRDVAAARRACA